ncbi:MAG: TIGR01777 family oxidoreductase [Myxococcota bacterium]
MMVFERRSSLELPVEEVREWHRRPGALERLIPPWLVTVVGAEEGGSPADLLEMVLRVGLWRVPWLLERHRAEDGSELELRQLEGPFSRWRHTMRFVAEAEERCAIEDRIECELSGGVLGEALLGRTLERSIERALAHRHRVLAADLPRHRAYLGQGDQRVALTGSSGLVGRTLAAFLRSGGHRPVSLVRDPAAAGRPDTILWNPSQGELEPEVLEGCDAVVHLTGAGVATGRWTPERKRLILESRLLGTQTLCRALARMGKPPRVLISASAVGYYGERGDATLDEANEPGSGFLSEVCHEWEEATRPAQDRGIRVVKLRIGLVLSGRGGALPRMCRPFRLGLGGPVGSGRQYWSWIALDDLVAAILHLIFTDSVHGAVNAVAPTPVRQRDFARTLGRVLRRPALLPLPAPVVRAALGELGQALLLESARVSSARLEGTGFRFLYPELEAALRAELGR